MNPLETLKQYWGYESFRPLQQNIIQEVLQGKDILALLPTSSGKSLCFQVPALMQPGLCVVLSPLIALMKDQVDQLKQRGITAEAIFSGMPSSKIDLVLDRCIYGQVKFLYISPERLKTTLFRERITGMHVNLIAVDEAHCISEWGYDFRPAYLEIAVLRDLLPDVNIIALTATATPKVQEDIQEKLRFRAPVRFQGSFARENLVHVVRKTEDKTRQLLHVLQQVPGAAIVYVNTRKKTEKIVPWLQAQGIQATFYHAGLATSEREARQKAWIEGKHGVMVATNAFGMGINKPDVRTVVHLDLPHTLEAYYQEAGRAGRDTKKAYTIVLYDDQDVVLLREHMHTAHPDTAQLRQVYQHLANYYQIAVGSHSMTTYDFVLEDFAHVYELKPRVAYRCLKMLEQEGLVQLSEAFYQPAQLRITVAPHALYVFRVAHVTYDALLKTLLRLYGGELFTTLHQISIQHIARLLHHTTQAIHQQLQTLDRLKVVQYHPQKSIPQLTFITPRHPAATLPLSKRRIQQRNRIAKEKTSMVLQYVQQQHNCRVQRILEYLHETVYPTCGQCDVCLEKKRGQNNHVTDENQQYRHLILQYVQEGPCDLKTLVDKVDFRAQESVLIVIRQMLDRGELTYDTMNRLVVPG